MTQTILITGTSSGFGRLTALTLAARGHRVYAGMRDVEGRNRTAAEGLRAEAQASGGSLDVIELDVTSETSVNDAVALVLSRGRGLDVLINNAGIAAAGLIETFTPEQSQRIFDVNVHGPLRLARAVLPVMRARGRGLLVYVSSTLAREITPFLGLYGASKFALDALAESLWYETASLGIDTMIVQPGTFPTTAILGNLVAAAEPARAAGYGSVGAMPEKLFAGIGAMVSAGQAPDPNIVAQAIADAVDAPAGGRSLRVVIDPNGTGGAVRINAVCADAQTSQLAALGLGALIVVPRS